MKTILLITIYLASLTAHAGQSVPINGWLASDTDSKSVPLRLDAGDVITLQFPTASTRPPKVCVLAHSNSVTLAGKTITLTFHITAAPNVIWGGGYSGGCNVPPNMRLYFTTLAGNFNLNASNKTPSSCWWSGGASGFMANVDDGATYTFMATFDPSTWTNAHGQTGTSVPVEWSNALATAVQVGLGFGNGCFFDTGVNANIATLHVESMVIQ